MPATSTIDTVTLDAAGTLIRVAKPVGETYAEIAKAHGAVLSVSRLNQAFHEIFPSMPPMAFGPMDEQALAQAEREWWRDLVSKAVARAGAVEDFDAYFDTLFRHYADGQAWRAYPEVLPTLRRLKERGLRTAVVSNFDSRLLSILTDLGITPWVDAVVFSTGCGVAKPDPRIFRRALETLGSAPRTSLHVGDNLDADHRGAIGAGMAALHLERKGSKPVGGVTRIVDLTGVEDHLGGLV